EQMGFVQDSPGAGKYRGGCGMRKDIRLLAGPVLLTNLSDRYKQGPWGLWGGSAGETGSATLVQNGTRRSLESKLTAHLEAGDVLEYTSSAAGGWGHPFDRDPARV